VVRCDFFFSVSHFVFMFSVLGKKKFFFFARVYKKKIRLNFRKLVSKKSKKRGKAKSGSEFGIFNFVFEQWSYR
jgi:hypothetical protein